MVSSYFLTHFCPFFEDRVAVLFEAVIGGSYAEFEPDLLEVSSVVAL